MSSSTALPTIALFPWGDWIEDFLDSINISFESFCQHMTGGWLFGYVEALKLEGIQTIIFCVSARVAETTRYTHTPTGATICVVPASGVHRRIRQEMVAPYGWDVIETYGKVNPLQRPFLALLKDIAPYLATPIWSLLQELRRENCCAILCQEYEYARFDICMLLGQFLGLPVYASFQGGNFQLSRLEQFIRPHTLKRCAGLIVPSQVEAKRLQAKYALPPHLLTPIFNPLDLHLWQGEMDTRVATRMALQIPETAKVVVYHGRMEIYRKGLDVLLDAWIHLCRDYPDQHWWLLLVGTGSDAELLGDCLSSHSHVCWVNEYVLDRKQMQRYLRSADLYVLPSRHEGFPVAPLEAMACGLPVVATDAPGVTDIFEQGEAHGGVVVPKEEPTALADAIARFLQHDDFREKIGQNALNRVTSKFSLPSVGRQLRTVLAAPHID